MLKNQPIEYTIGLDVGCITGAIDRLSICCATFE